MRSLALVTLSLWAFSLACQPRKSSLLPPRSNPLAGQTALQAREPVSDGELAPGSDSDTDSEGQGDNESEGALSDGEIGDLQKVKQDALDRLREIARPLPGDPRQARRLLRHARALVREDRLAEAQEYHLVACQMGLVEGCHKFGWYEQKSGNWQNAGQFYKIACSGGSAKSCNNLGLQLEKQQKWEAALDAYATACLNRHSVACGNLKKARDKQREALDKNARFKNR